MRTQVYHTTQQRDEAACDAAIRWGAEAELTVEEVLLVAERATADAGRRLAREYDLGPEERQRLTGTAERLSLETEALRLRLGDDLADLQRIERERYVYDRKRGEQRAAELPEHLMDLGVALAKVGASDAE